MPSDDILDLIGRYATGSLSAEEQKRLFDAALDDQDLFDQLVREQDMKQMLDEPGVRDRMIRALEPPKRKTAWIYGVAATATLSIAIAVVLLRPAPKPQQVATATIPTPSPVVQTETTPPPAPVKAAETSRRDLVDRESAKAQPKPASNARAAASPEPSTDTAVVVNQPAKDAEKKESTQQVQVQASTPVVASAETVQVTTAPPPPQQQFAPKQPGTAGGPRQQQMSAQGRVVLPTIGGLLDSKTPALGFHYSVEIQGHLSIIPAVDGYLFVKTNDGTILFGPKLSAAGIIVDLPLTDAISSVVITFSDTSTPVTAKPSVRTELTGNIEGKTALAAEIKIK